MEQQSLFDVIDETEEKQTETVSVDFLSADFLEELVGEPLLSHQKEIIDASMEFIEQRNAFQQRVSPAEIKRIENKMLDFSLRKREDSSAKALTKEERLTYADYLESKNQPLGAKHYRNYVEPIQSTKKGK